MLPVINLGPLALPTGPLLYILGAWAALSLIERVAKQEMAGQATAVYNVATTALFAGIIGARLSFVFLHWSAFQNNLLSIVWPLNTGYAPFGGLFFGLAAAFFSLRRERLAPAPLLDVVAPGIVVALMTISLVDFLAGGGYGTTTTLPWGLSLFELPVKRHPVQIYELLVGGIALLAWWRTPRLLQGTAARFLMTVIVYGTGRLFVDAFRANSATIDGGYLVSQIVSFLLVAAALFWIARQLPTE